jgi:hypothetical protein
MSEDIVDEPFKSAARRVKDAYDKTAEEFKARVQKSKAEALKKVSH